MQCFDRNKEFWIQRKTHLGIMCLIYIFHTGRRWRLRDGGAISVQWLSGGSSPLDRPLWIVPFGSSPLDRPLWVVPFGNGVRRKDNGTSDCRNQAWASSWVSVRSEYGLIVQSPAQLVRSLSQCSKVFHLLSVGSDVKHITNVKH